MGSYTQHVYNKYIDKLFDSINSPTFKCFSDQFNTYESEKVGGIAGVYIGRYLLKAAKRNSEFLLTKNNIAGIKFNFWDQHISKSLTQITRIKILYRFNEPELEGDSVVDLIELPANLFLPMLNDDEKEVISACINYHVISDKDIKASPMTLKGEDFFDFSYNLILSTNIKFRNYIFNDLVDVYSDSLLEIGNTSETVNLRYDSGECMWFYNTQKNCNSDTYMILYYHKFITNKYPVIHSFLPTICCGKQQVGLGWLDWNKAMKNMLEYEKDFFLYYINKALN
ncbi:MAG: hypothetical protein SGJ10_05960 [Bacteroidota bacterium]|nr:hypothetical protein [Bacteroidota bacterium]